MLDVTDLFDRVIVGVPAMSAALLLIDPVFAGTPTTVPGPLLGAGLPGLVVAGAVVGGIWLTRKLRNR